MQINVLYSTDSCYVQYAYASINSLLFNNANIDNIKIYLIEDNLADFEKENIQSLICKYKNAEIKFIDINTIMNNSGIVKKDFFKLVGYSRLFIQDIINVDKILYLDCDTIVANNLLELWNIDINDYLIAGVQDTVLEYSKTIVGMDMNTRYINSGVLLINLKKWREENIKNKFLKMINDFNGYVPLHDQGIVNGVCKGKIFYLNPKFNCMSQFYQFSEKQIKKLYNIKSFYSKKEICNAIQYPVIIHYIAKFYNRPWCEDCSHPKKKSILNIATMNYGKENW